MGGISWLAEELLASQERLCSMQLEFFYVRQEMDLYTCKWISGIDTSATSGSACLVSAVSAVLWRLPLVTAQHWTCSWFCQGTPHVSWIWAMSPGQSLCPHPTSGPTGTPASSHSLRPLCAEHPAPRPLAQRPPCSGLLPSCSLSVSQNNKSTETGCPETSWWRQTQHNAIWVHISLGRISNRWSTITAAALDIWRLCLFPGQANEPWCGTRSPQKTFRRPVEKFRYNIHMDLRRQVVRMCDKISSTDCVQGRANYAPPHRTPAHVYIRKMLQDSRPISQQLCLHTSP